MEKLISEQRLPAVDETIVHPMEKIESRLGMPNTPLINACVDGDAKAIEAMLNEYKDYDLYINLTDKCNSRPGYYNTALILAAFGGHTYIAIQLINCGADVNQANNYGITPLHYACLLRDHILINKLLEKGASWDAEDKVGVTPLELYLHEFDKFPGYHAALREIELIEEHLHGFDKFTKDRPVIEPSILLTFRSRTHKNISLN